MKKLNIARIAILVLSLALLIGTALCITAAAEESTGEFGGISVAYGEKVAIRVAVDATPEEITAGDVVVTYTINGSTKNASYFETDESGRVWVITEGIAAYDLGQQVVFNSYVGETQVESNCTYSVAQFLYKMLYIQDGVTTEWKNVYSSLLTYASNVQIALDKNADKLVNKSTLVYSANADIKLNGSSSVFSVSSVDVTPTYNGTINAGDTLIGWHIRDNGVEKDVDVNFTATGVVEILSANIKTHDFADEDSDNVCDACEGPAVVFVTEGPDCSFGSATVVQDHAPLSVTPVYTGSDYVIDFWSVRNSEGKIIAYVENGESILYSDSGAYTVSPVFIANTSAGVSDGNLSFAKPNGSAATSSRPYLTADFALESWAEKAIGEKLHPINGTTSNYTLMKDAANQSYLTADPQDAANVVLLYACNAGNVSGGQAEAAFECSNPDATDTNAIVAQFDFYLDYSGNSGVGTAVAISDGTKTYALGRILTMKGVYSAGNNGNTAVSGGFSYTASKADQKIDATAGGAKVTLNGDAWYTFRIVLKGDTVTTSYALRGSDEFTQLDSQTMAGIGNIDPTKLSFYHPIYGARTIYYYDNVSLTKTTIE